MSSPDYQFALLLQKQFEYEAAVEKPTNHLVYKKGSSKDPTKSLVDPSWELVDPTPDIHILFVAFNEKYFWNKLLAVTVSWSKRMTTCAGICSYQGRAGLCSITLSDPLLKLRPRKDLVETLLHEMIHAYLFVTHNNRDRDGHGPEFHKHMYRINAEAGTNITVYHDFHDEVRLYKVHWWRCNGPCQHRGPYFGMVKRATNRAPGPNDFWWGAHQQNCGGTYIKVKEPEKTAKSKSGKENKTVIDPKKDIRKFFPVVNNKNSNAINKPNVAVNGAKANIVGFKDLSNMKPKNALKNSSSTIVVTKKQPTSSKSTSAQPPLQTNTKSSVAQPKPAFSGTGQSLSSKSTSGDYETVRNHWLNKFNTKRNADTNPLEVSKKPKIENTRNGGQLKVAEESKLDLVTCPVCHEKFTESVINEHVDQCLVKEQPNGHFESVEIVKLSKCPVCDREFGVNVIEIHVETCLSDVFNNSEEPIDQNTSSDTGEENTSSIEWIPNDSESVNESDLIPCLVCSKKIPRRSLNEHLEDCMGGDNIFNNSQANIEEEKEPEEEKEEEKKEYNCPICLQICSVLDMSGHLDECLAADEEKKDSSFMNSFLDEVF